MQQALTELHNRAAPIVLKIIRLFRGLPAHPLFEGGELLGGTQGFECCQGFSGVCHGAYYTGISRQRKDYLIFLFVLIDPNDAIHFANGRKLKALVHPFKHKLRDNPRAARITLLTGFKGRI